MSELALKCENNAIFKQNYSKKLFISFKISYSCCFGFRGNLEFPEFIHKKFNNINYRLEWGVGTGFPPNHVILTCRQQKNSHKMLYQQNRTINNRIIIIIYMLWVVAKPN